MNIIAKEWTDEPYSMKCGSYEAEKRVYKKLIGKSGRTWMVATQDNPADNIYVSAHPRELQPGYRGFQGFAGRTLSFTLEDGSVEELRAPWHGNSDALFKDTEYDVRDKYSTFGVIGLDREYKGPSGYVVTIIDVLYEDDDWVIGEFNRVEKIAQQLANELDKSVVCFSKSQGGSSCGFVEPEKENNDVSL